MSILYDPILRKLRSGGSGGAADSSRLLPAGMQDGELVIWDASVDRGNNSATKFLLQGSLTDEALGNAAPVPVANSGIVISEAGTLVFNGSSHGTITGGTLPAGCYGGDGVEFTLDLIWKCTDGTRTMQGIFGRDPSPRCDILYHTDTGLLEIGGGPSLGSGWALNTWHHLTMEVYSDPAYQYGMTVAAYRNGSLVQTSYWSPSDLRAGDLYIGRDKTSSDSRIFTGEISVLRIRTGAEHRGVSFSPLPLPWLEPLGAPQRLTLAQLKTKLAELP